MTHTAALSKLFKGSELRSTKWEKDRFIHLNKEGQIVDNKGKTFNMMTSKEKTWELYKKSVTTSNVDNDEVMNAIKELSLKFDTLADTVYNLDQIDASDIAHTVQDSLNANIEETIKNNLPLEEKKHEETVKLFYGVETHKEVREAFKQELGDAEDKLATMKVITKYIPFCAMGGRKVNTIIRFYTDMRNIIKEVGGDLQDLSLDLFSVDQEVYDRRNEISATETIKKLANTDKFEIKEVKDLISNLKETVKTIMNKGDKLTLADFEKHNLPIAKQQTAAQARGHILSTYLAFVTGRRFTEIMKTLSIYQNHNVWMYKGLLKKGAQNIELKAISLDNDFEFISKLLTQIRSDFDGTIFTNGEVNNKWGNIFNRAFKRITGTSFTFHNAREIYAEIAYIENAQDNGSDREEQDYKASILGHQIDLNRLISTDHYRTLKGK